MKNRFLILLPVLCLFLSSCFEIKETYNLKEDGSYDLAYEVNMASIIDMIATMAPDSVKKTDAYKLGKDTAINIEASLPDSARRTLKPEQLAMMKKTNVRMQMNPANKLFKISFTNDGKSTDELKYFLNNFSNNIEKSNIGNLFSSAAGMPEEPAGNNKMDMSFSKNEFDYVINPNLFQRIVKPTTLAAHVEEDKKVYEMIKAMNMKLTSIIVVNLPRPAKSIENPKAVLSADKKQFTLEVDMLEASKTPEILNFKINY